MNLDFFDDKINDITIRDLYYYIRKKEVVGSYLLTNSSMTIVMNNYYDANYKDKEGFSNWFDDLDLNRFTSLFVDWFGDMEVYSVNKETYNNLYYGIDDIQTDEDILNLWYDKLKNVYLTHFAEWSRLWYDINLYFNPLYNVDGVETTKYLGDMTKETGTTTNDMTVGTGKTTSVSSEVPYDSTSEKEVGKDVVTSDSRVDNATTTHGKTVSTDYTVELKRAGNIGVTKSTDLLESVWAWRQRSFLEDIVFSTIKKEMLMF